MHLSFQTKLKNDNEQSGSVFQTKLLTCANSASITEIGGE